MMTKRERCMRTMRFEETDRTPLYDIIQNDAITEHFSGRPLTYEDGDHTVCLAIGHMLDMTRMVAGPARPEQRRTDDGTLIQVERYTSWVLERPFKDLDQLASWVRQRIIDLEKRTFSPDDARLMHERIESRWAAFAENDPTGRHDPTVLVIESGVGLTEMYHTAGMDLFCMLMFEQPDLVEEWLEARLQAELRRVETVGDPWHIPIVLTYDDIAHKTGTLFSTDWLCSVWIPRLARLVNAWHTRDALCVFHSDGNLWSVLPDLVSTGIDGLNPLEVLAGMEVASVRKAYPRLALTGGIDVSQLLPYGSPGEVRAVCRQAISDTQGLGYFMGSSTELHWDVKLENAIAMAETAWTSGPSRP